MQAPSNDFSELVSELKVAQQDLWLQENDAQPHLYFDTADVRRALLGANQYISWQDAESMAVNVKEFEKREVLVDSLMAAMFLGPFSMLPPHQAELLRQLKSDEAFVRVPKRIDQTTFLQQVGIDSRWGSDICDDVNEGTLKETLDKHVGAETERFFKAIQCIRMPWWEQLRRLTGKKTFMQCTAEFNYQALLKQKEFQRLLAAFKHTRPTSHAHDSSKNNFADTISMLMLIELVRRYRSGESKSVPRFFDSSGLFARAAKEADVLGDLLIVSDGGLKSSALVSANALVYKAALISRTDRGELFAKLREAVEGREQASDEVTRLDNLVRDRIQPLGTQLRQVIDLSFLERVWLKTMALEELRDIAKRWVAESALTEHFRETVDLTVEASVKDVLSGAIEYKLVSNAWVGLRQELLIWRGKQLEIRSKWPGPDTELGLFRFGPKAETTTRVSEVLEVFVDDQLNEHQITGLRAWHDLLACCMDIERSRERTAEMSANADFVAGALWAIGAHLRIVDFLRAHVALGSSFFVKTIYVAAMLKLGRNLRKVENGIEELCATLRARNKASAGEMREDVLVEASSVAYLWFHLWRAHRIHPPHWRSAPTASVNQHRGESAARYLTGAIDCVEMACECARSMTSSDDHWRERQMYVANQRLYYLVEEGSESRIGDIEDAYNGLVGFRDIAKGLWRSTYSDTLARYWAFLAYRSNSAKDWHSFMDEANSNFADAAPADKFESEVNTFGAYLKKTSALGFQSRPKPSATAEVVAT